MIDVDLDFIIKGIESQGATCIVKPRSASLKLRENGIIHIGKAISFIHNKKSKGEFTLFVGNRESKRFHHLARAWNNGNLPRVFWFIEPGNILRLTGDGMYI